MWAKEDARDYRQFKQRDEPDNDERVLELIYHWGF